MGGTREQAVELSRPPTQAPCIVYPLPHTQVIIIIVIHTHKSFNILLWFSFPITEVILSLRSHSSFHLVDKKNLSTSSDMKAPGNRQPTTTENSEPISSAIVKYNYQVDKTKKQPFLGGNGHNYTQSTSRPTHPGSAAGRAQSCERESGELMSK